MAHTVAPLELRPPEQAADPAARGRTCARRQDFVLDLGRDCFLVADGRVERWSRESGHARFLVYCADYGPTASVGVAQAPGSLQYAEILVRKRLEERGELTADTQLLVYEKHKTVSGDIRVVYQIAPKLRVAEVLRAASSLPAGAVAFDAVALLQGLLRRMPAGRTHGLALVLDDSVVFLVGRGREILFARRYPRIAEDEVSLAETAALLQQDAISPATGLGAGLTELLWIEPLRFSKPGGAPGLTTEPSNRGSGLRGSAPPFVAAPLVELRMGHGRCWSALPPLVSRLSYCAAKGGRAERWLRPLERWEPLLWTCLALGALVLFGLSFSYAVRGRAAQAAAQAAQAEIAALEAAAPSLPALDQAQYEGLFKLAETLNRAAEAPRLAMLWNKLAAAKPAGVEVKRLSIDYGEAGVDIALDAALSEDFFGAQTLARAFVDRLEQAGFAVVERSLSLERVRENRFSLRLRYAQGRS